MQERLDSLTNDADSEAALAAAANKTVCFLALTTCTLKHYLMIFVRKEKSVNVCAFLKVL